MTEGALAAPAVLPACALSPPGQAGFGDTLHSRSAPAQLVRSRCQIRAPGATVAGPSEDSAPAEDARALVALAAGAFALGIDSSPYRGTVTGAAFRRGRAEVTVEVDGIGRVTALAPAGTALPVGSTVGLTPDPAGIALIPVPEAG